MTEFTKEQIAYIRFMTDPCNEYNCDECMENRGQTWPEHILPCGQQVCWVTSHCKNEKDHESRKATEDVCEDVYYFHED